MSLSPLEELKTIVGLAGLPDEHLQWILDHTNYVEFEDGQVIMRTGESPDFMMLIIEGAVSFYMDQGGTLVHFFDFGNDQSTGGVTGLLPYSRMKKSPGTSFAVGKLRGYRMHKDHFADLERISPTLIQRIIGYMTERARAFATTQLQHEKVSALGKLAAGIAHELNNPAAAINRISAELTKRLKENYGLTEKLLKHQISSDQLQVIGNLVEQKEQELGSQKRISPMERIKKEDEMNDWLENNSLQTGNLTCETFIDAGFNNDDLETIRKDTSKEAFADVLLWTENLLSSRRVIKDLEEASTRISHLVGAIKSHVHMDQTNDLQLTDIHNDIENTLTLLGYKLREKNIIVKKSFCDNLPLTPAYIGELNQVWTNLIDNAIFALSKNGELTIETSCDSKNVKIKIVDNGTGIPPEIISRIFDPFFTTKKVGQGTGIGLDLASRVIKRHNGDIKVNSQPGRTEFTVCIPVAETKKNNE